MTYFLRLRSNGKEKRAIFCNFRQPPSTLHIHSSDRERTWPEAHCHLCDCRAFSTMQTSSQEEEVITSVFLRNESCRRRWRHPVGPPLHTAHAYSMRFFTDDEVGMRLVAETCSGQASRSTELSCARELLFKSTLMSIIASAHLRV